MKRLLLMLAIIIYSATEAMAGIQVTINKNPVSLGETFAITITTNGESEYKGTPKISGLKVIQKSQSSKVEVIGNRMSSLISNTFYMKANKTGTIKIGPFISTKNEKSNIVNLQVVKETAEYKAKKQREQSEQQQADAIISKNLFVKSKFSKTSAYVGEQIVATYELYVNPEMRIGNTSIDGEPVLDGFWVQRLDNQSNSSARSEVVNGKRFTVYPLYKAILIPQRGGKQSVKALSFDCVVQLVVNDGQRRRRSMWDDFFSNQQTKNFNYTAKSKVYTLDIKDLPAGQPENFTGAVGQYTMQSWLDRTETETNNPVTLKVKVEGKGNLKLVEPWELTLPTDIESYDPQVSENISTTSSGMSGNKTFEYLLIPRREGQFEIDPVEFSYFDPKTKQYKVLSSESFAIQVAKGEEGAATDVIRGIDKEEVQLLGKDIRFIKNNIPDFQKGGSPFFLSATYYLGVVTPWLLLLIFVFYKKRNDELNSNTALLKNKQASKVVKKRLSEAKKFMESGSNENFYEEMTKALWGYISDKLNIAYADLTKDKAREELRKHNISEIMIDRLMEIIDNCEFARYAPSNESNGMSNTYDEAASLITDMEGSLK